MTTLNNYIKFILNIKVDNVSFFKFSLDKYLNHDVNFRSPT